MASNLPFNNPKYAFIKKKRKGTNWIKLAKILKLEESETSIYAALTAPPPLLPTKKYCDITGLLAPYVDPQSGLRFSSADVFYFIRNNLTTHEQQQFLQLRNAHTVIKWWVEFVQLGLFGTIDYWITFYGYSNITRWWKVKKGHERSSSIKQSVCKLVADRNRSRNFSHNVIWVCLGYLTISWSISCIYSLFTIKEYKISEKLQRVERPVLHCFHSVCTFYWWARREEKLPP